MRACDFKEEAVCAADFEKMPVAMGVEELFEDVETQAEVSLQDGFVGEVVGVFGAGEVTGAIEVRELLVSEATVAEDMAAILAFGNGGVERLCVGAAANDTLIDY